MLERLWDLFCIASVIGIWPRFIEPSLILTSRHKIAIPTLPHDFEGLRIVQISDLHYSSYESAHFLKKISKKVQKLNPDIICFTGDLLSYAELTGENELKTFLSSLKAPLGCFAIFGNHDYSDYISEGNDGSYQRIHDKVSPLLRGFTRLIAPQLLQPEIQIKEPVAPSLALKRLFESSGFKLLHNETVQVGHGIQKINITGLGGIMAGQLDPQTAFSFHDLNNPTIVLSHNPDSYPLLLRYPGELMLFGHTHGGQVNLPYIWKKITPLKNKELKSGLVIKDGRYLYINRGLGSCFPFRWFAPPEISLFELTRGDLVVENVEDPLFAQAKETLEPAG
jgi:predicted MPP superfamily phosphohydrolase